MFTEYVIYYVVFFVCLILLPNMLGIKQKKQFAISPVICTYKLKVL